MKTNNRQYHHEQAGWVSKIRGIIFKDGSGTRGEIHLYRVGSEMHQLLADIPAGPVTVSATDFPVVGWGIADPVTVTAANGQIVVSAADLDNIQSPSDISRAASALGKKGGSTKSETKAAAARANGAKGGRPPLSDAKRVYWVVFYKSTGRNAFAYCGANSKRDAGQHAKRIDGIARRYVGGHNVPDKITIR